MENSKKRLNELAENIDDKLKNSFHLIKKDILEIKNNLKDKNLLSPIKSTQEKFAVEVKRYKEETKLIREILKNLDRRIRDLENHNALETQEPKFWGNWKSLDI